MIFGRFEILHNYVRNIIGVLLWTWAIFLFMIEYYGGIGNNLRPPPVFRNIFALLLKVLIVAPFGTNVAGEEHKGIGRHPANVQYMAMDPDGQYSFAYSSADSSRQERKNADGSITGKYTYTDPNGSLVRVDYTADAINGFKAYGDNIPTAPVVSPVQDTQEVKEARQKFLAVYAQEYANAKAAEAQQILLVKDAEKLISQQEILTDPVSEVFSSLEKQPDYSQKTSTSSVVGGVENKIVTRNVVSQNSIQPIPIPAKSEQQIPANKPGPSYFYYVGVGGQPYYVAPPPRTNIATHVSVRASQVGAIPVSAVHDVQIPNYHRASNSQHNSVQPVYVEIGKDYGATQYHPFRRQQQPQQQQQNFGFRQTFTTLNQPAHPNPPPNYGSTTTVFTLPYFGYPAYIY